MPEPTSESVIRLSVSLYPDEMATVTRFAEETGLQNVSAALRFIINDWSRCRKQPAGETGPEPGGLGQPGDMTA